MAKEKEKEKFSVESYKAEEQKTVNFKVPKGPTVTCYFDAPLEIYMKFGKPAPTYEMQHERNELFGRYVLISWNIVDPKDDDIPADGVGMNLIPNELALEIVRQWVSETTEVDDPLVTPSEDGGTSKETT